MLLIQACEQGLPIDDYSKVIIWLEYLGQDMVFKKMLNLFFAALRANQEIEVLLMLGAIKAGLYSRDETVAKITI